MANSIEVVVLLQWEERRAEKELGEDLARHGEAGRSRLRPSRLAEELAARSRFLRSRPMKGSVGLQRFERELLFELDALETQARLLELDRRSGALSGMAYEVELAELDRLAFAARRRFAGLVEALDECFPSRASAATPAARSRELDAIERCLAEKKARAAARAAG